MPRLVRNDKKAMAALAYRPQNFLNIGKGRCFSPTFGVITGAECPLQRIQTAFVSNIACTRKNCPDRRPHQLSHACYGQRQFALSEGFAHRELDSRQRIYQRAVEIEQNAGGELALHFFSSTSMFDANSSGVRNGYISSRFGVRILPSGRIRERRRGSNSCAGSRDTSNRLGPSVSSSRRIMSRSKTVSITKDGIPYASPILFILGKVTPLS